MAIERTTEKSDSLTEVFQQKLVLKEGIEPPEKEVREKEVREEGKAKSLSFAPSKDEFKEIFSLLEETSFEKKEADTLGNKLLRLSPENLYELLLQCQEKSPNRYRELIEKMDHSIMVDLMRVWIKEANEGKSGKSGVAGELKTLQAVLNIKELKKIVTKEKDVDEYYVVKKVLSEIQLLKIFQELLFFSAKELCVILPPLVSFLLNGQKTPSDLLLIGCGTERGLTESGRILETVGDSLGENNPAIPLVAWSVKGNLAQASNNYKPIISLLSRISNPKILNCIIMQQLDLRIATIPAAIIGLIQGKPQGCLKPTDFTPTQMENLKNYAKYYEEKQKEEKQKMASRDSDLTDFWKKNPPGVK